jgi:DNA-binding PadR family transcriptional regulator
MGRRVGDMGSRDYLGEFEQVVLLALARLGDETYGGAIHREILDTAGRDVSIPSVYVTLKRMERKGLVASRVARTDGARATRNYRLLTDGREALERSRHLLERLWDGAGIPPVGQGES